MKDQQEVKFRPPQNASIPEEQNGETFDLVCTFRRKPDGEVCLTMFGDTPMPGYDKGKMQEQKPGYGSYVNSIKEQGYPNA